jgi:two-component system chemotaxis response regulator CheY
LKQEKVDLAILDNNMPGISGGELLEIIRDDKDLWSMPVIMITADANMEYVTKAAEMNPVDVIAFNHLGDLYLKSGFRKS